MSSLLAPWRSVHRRYSRLDEPFRRFHIPISKITAFTLLSAYVTLAALAYRSTLEPGSLTFRIGLCHDTPCVSWVMPAGQGWAQGVRPGMVVLSVNGRDITSSDIGTLSSEPIREAELRRGVQPYDPTGEVLHVKVMQNPVVQGPMKFSVWILGGMFALLGATVVVRRPDLHTARVFGVFAGVTALALAVVPSAGGPQPQWALIIQFSTIVGVGASLLSFVIALVGNSTEAHRPMPLLVFMGVGLIIILGYGVSVLISPSFYQIVRPVLFFFVSTSILGSIGLLLFKGIRQQSPASRQQAWICLWGIALGTLPLVAFYLIPEALGQDSLLPVHIIILAWALLPAAFAYAILQYQLMGIRRLVHRGMVYGITTLALLVLIALGLTLAVPSPADFPGGEYSYLLISAVLAGGVILFFPLRTGARWLADKLFFYSEVADYRVFLRDVNENLLTSNNTAQVATAIVNRLAQVLHLESVLLFLGPDPANCRLVAAAGKRAEDILQQLHPRLGRYIEGGGNRPPPTSRGEASLTPTGQTLSTSSGFPLMELHWESDSLLLAPLGLGVRYFGYILLGPKDDGEVFLEEEKRLCATLAPMLALAIDKSQLSEELRSLNQRLVKAEEGERARIASDLHDGPLQKALLLTGNLGTKLEDPVSVARQLVLELREIGSRLRPAVLDDLGIVSALDWLLEDVAKRSGRHTNLSVDNIGEDERFPPDLELALFRITQEATNNAVKHSQATSLRVSLNKEDDYIVLQVVDNGIGLPEEFPSPPFKKGSRGDSGGFGIPGMRERAIQLNGSFEIHATPGLGTTVIVQIPLMSQPSHQPRQVGFSSPTTPNHS